MGLLAGLEELHYYGISFLNKRVIFFVLITFITIFFSVIAFEPAEVVIIGPKFHEQEYFEEELSLISNNLDIKINYN